MAEAEPPDPPAPLLSTFGLGVVLALISLWPSIWALDDGWKALYVIVVIGVVCLMWLANRGEGRVRAAAEKKGERIATARYYNLQRSIQRVEALVAPASRAVEGVGPVGQPLLSEVEAVAGTGAMVLNQLISVSAQGHVTQAYEKAGEDTVTLGEVGVVLEDIIANPPTTPETVDAKVREIRNLTLKAETQHYTLTGNDIGLHYSGKAEQGPPKLSGSDTEGPSH